MANGDHSGLRSFSPTLRLSTRESDEPREEITPLEEMFQLWLDTQAGAATMSASAGLKPTDATIVDRALRKAFLAGLYWGMKRRSRKANVNEEAAIDAEWSEFAVREEAADEAFG
jgi:hypothetical protein